MFHIPKISHLFSSFCLIWCCIFHLHSTENINLLRKEGVAKIVGTGICVSGAILMVLYRGPAVIGFGNKDLAVSGLMGFRLERWYIGMLCLIGNCMCMAIYLTLQVL